MNKTAIKKSMFMVLLMLGVVWLGLPYACQGGEAQVAANVENKLNQDVLARSGQQSTVVEQSNVLIVGEIPALSAQTLSSRESEAELVDLSSSASSESRLKHAARINRRIFVVSVSILSFFIVCRLLLVRQITKSRKSLMQGQEAFEH